MNSQQSASPGQAGARIEQPDLYRLTGLFAGIGRRDREELLHGFLRHAIGLLNAAGAVIFAENDGDPAAIATLLSRQALAWAPDMEQQLARLARQARAGEKALYRSLADHPPVFLMACPLAGGLPACLTLVCRTAAENVEPLLVVGQLLAAILELQLASCDATDGDDSGMTGLLAEVLQAGGRDGLLRLTAGLRRLTGCSRVAIAGSRGSRMALLTLSDISSPDRRTEETRLLEKGIAECAGRSASLCWPAPDPEQQSPVLAEVGRATGSGCVAAVPLPGDSGSSGGLLLLWQEKPADVTATMAMLGKAAPLLAGCVQVLQQRSWRLAGGETGERQRRRRRLLMAGAVPILVLVLLIPVPFRVPASALVRPVTTRYVVARFDTILDKVLVDPGDRVHAGELLARLDGREISLQLAGLTAERDKAARMYDRYLAAGDTPAAQVARLDMERLDQQIDLLRQRQQHLRLVSPVDGIVLTGDLKRAEGGPVNKGQTLFEVAPLKTMNIELAIGEDDIARVRPGTQVVIRFDAFPGRQWQGTIQRIIPKSRIRDMRNVFIAELETANGDGRLRPGMRGEASIDCGRRSLGWILLHRPWYTLLHILDRFL